jgi:hypothetical protein
MGLARPVTAADELSRLAAKALDPGARVPPSATRPCTEALMIRARTGEISASPSRVRGLGG